MAAEVIECPICLEKLGDNPWSTVLLPCCSQTVCWDCLRRHAESVIDDARPDMNCPLSCKMPVPDVLVRSAFRRHQWSWHLSCRSAGRERNLDEFIGQAIFRAIKSMDSTLGPRFR